MRGGGGGGGGVVATGAGGGGVVVSTRAVPGRLPPLGLDTGRCGAGAPVVVAAAGLPTAAVFAAAPS